MGAALLGLVVIGGLSYYVGRAPQMPEASIDVATPSAGADVLSRIHEGVTVAFAEGLVGTPQLTREVGDSVTANYFERPEYLLTLFYRGSTVAGFTVVSTDDAFAPEVRLDTGDARPLGTFTFADSAGFPKQADAAAGRSLTYYVEALETGAARRFVDVYLGSIDYGAGGAAPEIKDLADAILHDREPDTREAALALRASARPNLYGEGRLSMAQLEKSFLPHATFESYFGSR